MLQGRRSADDTGNNLGEELRDILTALEADEEIGNLEEMLEVLERRQKDKLPALGDIPKRKLLEKTTKVDKVMCKFKIHRLQRLLNYFMQELLLLQIGWE